MNSNIQTLCKQLRYNILRMTTKAGSGHPTSSLSAVEVMAMMMFGGFFRAELDNPQNPNNDRLIFSKGHACPLLYSLYYALGHVSEEELMSLRKFDSVLEGHPTMRWKYTEAATGSLGQGLGVACGMAMALQKDFQNQPNFPNVWCLLGDSEMAEGSVWEAMNCASHYKLNNLIAVVDMNRLGQRGQTQLGHDTATMEARASSFGWEVHVVNGHDLEDIAAKYSMIFKSENTKPKMIIAKTFKGAGISFLADKEGHHGKALSQNELEQAKLELGDVDLQARGSIDHPETSFEKKSNSSDFRTELEYAEIPKVATRKAYGNSLNSIGAFNDKVVALDAEMSNSTFSEIFAKRFPERFFEMFIAEQNMISVATGLSRMGYIPFVSTFAAFLSRSADQIRMASYSKANLKIMGSHCGVSIGQDGSSQMAVEDIAFFRAILDSVVLYPCDAISTDRLMQKLVHFKGISYLRCTRAETPILYTNDEQFEIGGSKTLLTTNADKVTVLAAGITVFESLKAAQILANQGINIRVIDMYSIKPIDRATIFKASVETQAIITVEDHLEQGGLYESVCASGPISKPVHCLAVKKMSRSGTPEELMSFMQIDSEAIIAKVLEIIKEV
jgi:transketolase